MEANKDYWNKGLPLLDGIEFLQLHPVLDRSLVHRFFHKAGSITRVSAIRCRRERRRRGQRACRPHSSTRASFDGDLCQRTKRRSRSTIPGVRRASAPRVRQASTLVDAVKDITPMRVGGFIYPFSDFATPPDQMSKRLGYQEDPAAAIKEAQALWAASGAKDSVKSLDFMVRDIASFKVWAQAIQAMLQEGLGVQCNLRTVVESVWFAIDTVVDGNYDLAIGAVVSKALLGSVGLLQRVVPDRRTAELFEVEQPEVRCAAGSDRRRGRYGEAIGADTPVRGDHGGRPAAAAGGMGEHPRYLLQLREGS